MYRSAKHISKQARAREGKAYAVVFFGIRLGQGCGNRIEVLCGLLRSHASAEMSHQPRTPSPARVQIAPSLNLRFIYQGSPEIGREK